MLKHGQCVGLVHFDNLMSYEDIWGGYTIVTPVYEFTL